MRSLRCTHTSRKILKYVFLKKQAMRSFFVSNLSNVFIQTHAASSFLINILLLIMGMVIEAIPIILLMTPILFPLATSIGMNPIQFGVMMCLNLMIGLLTPPIGLNLFIMSSIAKVSIEGVIKEIWPFLIVMGVVLALIAIFPALVLWLPALVVN